MSWQRTEYWREIQEWSRERKQANWKLGKLLPGSSVNLSLPPHPPKHVLAGNQHFFLQSVSTRGVNRAKWCEMFDWGCVLLLLSEKPALQFAVLDHFASLNGTICNSSWRASQTIPSHKILRKRCSSRIAEDNKEEELSEQRERGGFVCVYANRHYRRFGRGEFQKQLYSGGQLFKSQQREWEQWIPWTEETTRVIIP